LSGFFEDRECLKLGIQNLDFREVSLLKTLLSLIQRFPFIR
jgi:hypothetical protein